MVGTLVAFELDDPTGAGDGWLQGVEPGRKPTNTIW
jgi:hypothetical protein